MEQQAISVTTISSYLKQILENDQLLYKVRVFGEISSYNVSNKITFFGLKDENALLSCIMFDNGEINNYQIGDKVIVEGSPNYYIKGGRLSFNVSLIEQLGKGNLYNNFLLIKEKLQKEGLFDLDRKKQLPQNIKRIGVATSETGAVIQDIINVAKRRNPEVDIVLFPTKVQGINAENSIIKALDYFDNYSNVDAIIVARGGGSEEDLAPFNTELIARKVSECSKFILSAVGHETNFTLVDFVADLRAPTPSAAAELLVKEKRSYSEMILSIKNKLDLILKLKLDNYYSKILSIYDKLNYSINKKIDDNSMSLALLIKEINSKNPLSLLDKGYVKIENKTQNKIIKNLQDIVKDDEIEAYLIDGKFRAKVEDVIK